MLGLGIYANGKFTNRANMDQVSNHPISLLAGNSHAYVADNLPLGRTSALLDLIGSNPLSTIYPTNPSLWPEAISQSGRSALKFDGASLLDGAVTLSGPKTIVMVGRLNEVAVGASLFSGRTGPSFQLYVGSTGVFAFNGGSVLAHTKAADTSLHVFVIVQDGANSVLNIDGVEVFGNAGSNVPTMLRLGGTSSTFAKTTISQLQVVPKVCDVNERAAIVKLLKADYGIA